MLVTITAYSYVNEQLGWSAREMSVNTNRIVAISSESLHGYCQLFFDTNDALLQGIYIDDASYKRIKDAFE